MLAPNTLAVMPETYRMPMDLITCEDHPKTIKNFIIKRLDDNNIELVYCDGPEESAMPCQSISDVHLVSEPVQPKAASDNREFYFHSKKSIEVPVIESNQPNSVIQHTPKPVKQEILLKPERLTVDVTTYACFKCSEQFNSLTLLRQHLKVS